MSGLSLKLAAPLRRSGALPTFMPMILATVKMITPDSADALSNTRICDALCVMSTSSVVWTDSLKTYTCTCVELICWLRP